MPPIRLDEHGQRRPTRPGLKCGREIAMVSLPAEHLKAWRW
jgi:hypothetical protein